MEKFKINNPRKLLIASLIIGLFFFVADIFQINSIFYLFLYYGFGVVVLYLIFTVYNLFKSKKQAIWEMRIQKPNIPYPLLTIPIIIALISWIFLGMIIINENNRIIVMVAIYIVIFALELVIVGFDALIRKRTLNFLGTEMGQKHEDKFPFSVIPYEGFPAVLFGLLFIIVGIGVIVIFISLGINLSGTFLK